MTFYVSVVVELSVLSVFNSCYHVRMHVQRREAGPGGSSLVDPDPSRADGAQLGHMRAYQVPCLDCSHATVDPGAAWSRILMRHS
jgi:hypothetical protein